MASLRGSIAALVAAAAAALPGVAAASVEDDLLALINARRAEPHDCGGRAQSAVPPLVPAEALASTAVGPGSMSSDLGKALAATGYLAATATSIVVTGPRDAAGVARFLESRDCAVLRDSRYAEIGIVRNGSAWRINLARPLLAADLGEWREAGRAVLGLVNEARLKPRTCGSRRFQAAASLAWNDALAAASLAHSRDMAEHDYFDHADRAGRGIDHRATVHGYRWHAVGENIAAGVGSAQQAVAGWLASPGHCANIMAPDFTEMGAAFAIHPA
ncbi:MAG: CAP domain-containing protein, partial [Caldimonas sp.]